MTELSRNSRRQWRRVGRHMIHEDLVTLNLTPEEILAELEPNWFQGEKDAERAPAEQDRSDKAAA